MTSLWGHIQKILKLTILQQSHCLTSFHKVHILMTEGLTQSTVLCLLVRFQTSITAQVQFTVSNHSPHLGVQIKYLEMISLHPIFWKCIWSPLGAGVGAAAAVCRVRTSGIGGDSDPGSKLKAGIITFVCLPTDSYQKDLEYVVSLLICENSHAGWDQWSSQVALQSMNDVTRWTMVTEQATRQLDQWLQFFLEDES